MTRRRQAWSPGAAGPALRLVDPEPHMATWWDFAACAETDPEAWFPEKGGSSRDAKKICARCPVRAQCLDWSLANHMRYGIWGGVSERDRRRLIRAEEERRSLRKEAS